MVNAPFRWEPIIGEWLESGHAQLDVEMLQSDDIEIPSIAQFNFKLVMDVLLQIFQQDHHQVEQYLDWTADIPESCRQYFPIDLP